MRRNSYFSMAWRQTAPDTSPPMNRGISAVSWKFRGEIVPTMMSKGTLKPTALAADDDSRRTRQLETNLQDIQRATLPARITPLPFSIVTLVFLAFVLLIGPVDRVVLRKLRLTRWTWVVFPSVCSGFTWLMVALANWHLGRDDCVGIFRIRDLDSDGGVLRETRIETLFAGHTRELVTRLANATAQDITDISSRGPADLDATTAGSLVAGYDLRRMVQQWNSRMTVFRSFEETPDDSGLDWSAIPKERPSRED